MGNDVTASQVNIVGRGIGVVANLATFGIIEGLKYHNRSLVMSSNVEQTAKLNANQPSIKDFCCVIVKPGKQTVHFNVSKITHFYKHATGTLRLQLCKYYWKYRNCYEYKGFDLLAEYRIGQIKQGYERVKIQVTVKLLNEGQQTRNCFTLFLEEYTSNGWRIKDYRDFDNVKIGQ